MTKPIVDADRIRTMLANATWPELRVLQLLAAKEMRDRIPFEPEPDRAVAHIGAIIHAADKRLTIPTQGIGPRVTAALETLQPEDRRKAVFAMVGKSIEGSRVKRHRGMFK